MTKKYTTQIGLRLPNDLLTELDEWLREKFAPYPAPTRTAIIEQWIREGLERARREGQK